MTTVQHRADIHTVHVLFPNACLASLRCSDMLCSSTNVTEVQRELIDAIRHVTAVSRATRMTTSLLSLFGTKFNIFRHHYHIRHNGV